MKKFIRSLKLIYAFIFFGVGSMTLGLILFPVIRLFIKDEDKRLEKYSYYIYSSWQMFTGLLESLGILKMKIKNREELENIKNSVIVASHPSFADVVLLMSVIPRTTCYVAEKLTRNFVMRNVVGSFFLPAGKPLDVLESDAKKMLDKGYNILIFPTGTRHKCDEHPKVRKGASLLASESVRDIYPVVIRTSADFLQTNQPFYKAGEETVEYDIELKPVIEISEYLDRYSDEVTLRKELTKRISYELFGD